MSCVVGVERDNEVWIGGDSAVAREEDEVSYAGLTPKVFNRPYQNRMLIMGYIGSFRFGQILQYHLDGKAARSHPSSIDFIVTSLVPSIRQALRKNGWLSVENEREGGCEFLLGYQGGLYEIGDEFEVTRASSGYLALGAGQDFALGAISALLKREPEIPPKELVEAGLVAAAEFVSSVRPPFTILSVRRGDPCHV